MLYIVLGFVLCGIIAVLALFIGANIANEIYDSWYERNPPADSQKKEGDAE